MGNFGSSSPKRANSFRNHDRTFKIVVIGDTNVGKSSLVRRYIDSSYREGLANTVCVDIRPKMITINNKRLKLQFWDTAGQEKFQAMNSSYYRRADGAIIVYDVTDEASFANVKNWLHELDKKCVNFKWILVGNKLDNSSQKKVSTVEARRFAEQHRVRFFETSAKDDINVTEMIATLANVIITAKNLDWDQNSVSFPMVEYNSDSASEKWLCTI